MGASRRVASTRIHEIPTTINVSSETIQACAGFGVMPKPTSDLTRNPTRVSEDLLHPLTPGHVVQIVGASGDGKTSLLRGLKAGISDRDIRSCPEFLESKQNQCAVFDLFDGEYTERANTLAMAGLAEPKLWARPAGALSVGEQARLRIAIAMHQAKPGDVMLVDEFASTIDRASVYSFAQSVRRWVSASGVTLVAASAHEDLEGMLGADTVIDARTQCVRSQRSHQQQSIRVETGVIEDYEQLAYLHYRSGKPATIVNILRAIREVPHWIHPSGELLAGVLCVSMPTLNGAWRERAWPRHFRTGCKSRDAKRLNDQLRPISRVIVASHSRGLGIASKLVRAYLKNPLTVGTEAIASMGAVSPFFARAGMCKYVLDPDPIDSRLLDALEHEQTAPHELVRISTDPSMLLRRELVTWGRKRKLLSTGPIEANDICRLIPMAVTRLCSRPRAYAFVKGQNGQHIET